MKSPILLFALKCSVILYFAACSGISDHTQEVSATPIVTKGAWRINIFTEAGGTNVTGLSGYSFTFDTDGMMNVSKDGNEISGNWSEDDILKKITISLDTNDPRLIMLNNHWNISSVSKTEVILQNTKDPSNGRLQLTSL